MRYNPFTKNFSAVVLCVFLLTTAVAVLGKEPLRGPVQTEFGPGGSDYAHKSLTRWKKGIGHECYEVFEPADPVPAKAGVVLLIHDKMHYEPEFYMGQIRHMCGRGWVVLFPRYQGTDQLETAYLFNIVRSVKDFLLQIFVRQKNYIDKSRFVITGNGIGAVLAANTAAVADYFGLPKPGAVMPIMPEHGFFKVLDLTGISRSASLLIISGDGADGDSAQLSADMFYAADRISNKNKIHIYVVSDYRGQPPLIADRLSPLSAEDDLYEKFMVENRNTYIELFRNKFSVGHTRRNSIDAFDWFVTFRYFDVLTRQAFRGNGSLNFLIKSQGARDMGAWSDGRPLKKIVITDKP